MLDIVSDGVSIWQKVPNEFANVGDSKSIVCTLLLLLAAPPGFRRGTAEFTEFLLLILLFLFDAVAELLHWVI